jgi:hypothetical protein
METTETTEVNNKEEQKSPFEEVKNLNSNSAVAILIQAAEVAQKSGLLSIRDSILMGGAIEFFTSKKVD